ncbi:AAA family ATPase [Dickeya fangzhongdai]|uniref:AAA family ATPase n=1 Tax=Dickeya fangzhongdai TaxID=1778540 RepID=UPI0033078220
MLRIERIIINGFKSEKKTVQVLFSASNVSIIFGQNGCGKTSLLKIIHAILTQNESVLIQNQINSIELYYSNNNSPQKITIKKSTSDLDKKGYYNWNQFIKSELFESSSLSLGVDRGMTSQTVKVEPRMIYDFFRSPFG